MDAPTDRDRELQAALGELPPHHRDALELRHFHDLSYEEIDLVFGLYFILGLGLTGLLVTWWLLFPGRVAAAHAVGVPDESRSHFKAMELMERGARTKQARPRAGSAGTWRPGWQPSFETWTCSWITGTFWGMWSQSGCHLFHSPS